LTSTVAIAISPSTGSLDPSFYPMPLDFQKARNWLSQFDFHNLFIDELGWKQPSSQKVESLEVEGTSYERKRIAEMAGVPVLEITSTDGEIPKADDRTKIHKAISEVVSLENLLIFVNGDRTRSLWYWAKRDRKPMPARKLMSVISLLICC